MAQWGQKAGWWGAAAQQLQCASGVAALGKRVRLHVDETFANCRMWTNRVAVSSPGGAAVPGLAGQLVAARRLEGD